MFATGTSCAAIWRPRSIDPILHLWHSSFCLSGFLVTSPAVLFIWFSEFFIFNASGLFFVLLFKNLCFLAEFSVLLTFFVCIADLLHSADFFFLFADVPLYGLIKFICLFLSSFRLLIIFYQKTEIVTLHFAYLYIFGFSIHGVTISCKSHAADFLKFLMFVVVSASLGLDIWIFFEGEDLLIWLLTLSVLVPATNQRGNKTLFPQEHQSTRDTDQLQPLIHHQWPWAENDIISECAIKWEINEIQEEEEKDEKNRRSEVR